MTTRPRPAPAGLERMFESYDRVARERIAPRAAAIDEEGEYPHDVFALSRPQTEDIGIVVLASPLSSKGIVAQGSSYPLDLISCDAHTDTGVTD